jgi:hypothetical protein
MPFDDALLLRAAAAGQWELVCPLVFRTRAGESITVPAGFRTDLASVPRLLQGLVPVNGAHRPAAVLHDYLFVVQDRPRAEVDRIFLDAMEDTGTRATQRWVMWVAVRVGGWLPWRRHAAAIARDRAGFLASHGLPPHAADGCVCAETRKT